MRRRFGSLGIPTVRGVYGRRPCRRNHHRWSALQEPFVPAGCDAAATPSSAESRILEPMPRLILVSNRLPVTARLEHGELSLAAGAGGVVSGLAGFHEAGDGLWIGLPGGAWRLSTSQQHALAGKLADLRAVPVELNRGEVERYYEAFSNGILWPLLHYE